MKWYKQKWRWENGKLMSIMAGTVSLGCYLVFGRASHLAMTCTFAFTALLSTFICSRLKD